MPASYPSKIRLNAGLYKGRTLRVLPAVRPTPERVRQTLFNWLQHFTPGTVCLDCFSGTGALGLEALSRGAERVYSLDASLEIIRELQAIQKKWGIPNERWSIQHWQAPALPPFPPSTKFDIVLLDPPFATRYAEDCFEQCRRQGLLQTEAWIYVEHDPGSPAPQWPGLRPYRKGRAGAVCYHLLQWKTEDPPCRTPNTDS